MKRLDHQLDCKKCGTIYLDLPQGAAADTPIHCSGCHAFLGTWSELQRDFYRQAGQGVFYLHDGQIDALTVADVAGTQAHPAPASAPGVPKPAGLEDEN